MRQLRWFHSVSFVLLLCLSLAAKAPGQEPGISEQRIKELLAENEKLKQEIADLKKPRPLRAREINSTDAKEIARQVDFSKEYVAMLCVSALGDVTMSFTYPKGKDVPDVLFTFNDRNTQTVGCILHFYAIAKNTALTYGGDSNSITSSAFKTPEELTASLKALLEKEEIPMTTSPGLP